MAKDIAEAILAVENNHTSATSDIRRFDWENITKMYAELYVNAKEHLNGAI